MARSVGSPKAASGVAPSRSGISSSEDREAWHERRLDAEELIDAGDCVVVLLHEFRRGKGSGVETETDTAMVYEVRDGRVVRIQGYMDRDEALEAAGVRE